MKKKVKTVGFQGVIYMFFFIRKITFFKILFQTPGNLVSLNKTGNMSYVNNLMRFEMYGNKLLKPIGQCKTNIERMMMHFCLKLVSQMKCNTFKSYVNFQFAKDQSMIRESRPTVWIFQYIELCLIPSEDKHKTSRGSNSNCFHISCRFLQKLAAASGNLRNRMKAGAYFLQSVSELCTLRWMRELLFSQAQKNFFLFKSDTNAQETYHLNFFSLFLRSQQAKSFISY